MHHETLHLALLLQESVQRLQGRARAAGLTNITASVGRIEEYDGEVAHCTYAHMCLVVRRCF